MIILNYTVLPINSVNKFLSNIELVRFEDLALSANYDLIEQMTAFDCV